MSETKCTCGVFYNVVNVRMDHLKSCPMYDQPVMSETKIPDDLKNGYEWLVDKGDVSMVPMSIAWVLKLIERIAAVEAREKELRKEIEQLKANPAEHVAWLCYHRHNGMPTTIHICDSDAEGAFAVYKSAYTASDWNRLNRAFKVASDKTIDQDMKIEALENENASLRAEVASIREVVKTHPTVEIKSRHSDYGKDADGYCVLSFDGERIGNIFHGYRHRDAAEKLVKYVASLRAQLAEATKPVTDEEWAMNSYKVDDGNEVAYVMERVDVNDLLSSRAAKGGR